MQEIEAKSSAESAVEDHIYKIFPNDLNSNNTVFGGLIMATIDRTALVVAERHSRNTCVTASVDALHYLCPALKGDTLIFKAKINRAWNSSMEIGVKVVAENIQNSEPKHVVSAYLTFVALANSKPTKVPQVLPKTIDEKRRFWEAGFRRKQRLKTAEELHKMRKIKQESNYDE